jgi:hypothetical protein
LDLVSGSDEGADADRGNAGDRVDADAVVRRAAGSWSLVDERVVVRSASTGLAVVLDPVSSVLWRCLDGASALGDVVADMADAFGVPAQRAAAELLPVVESWWAEGLVGLAPSGASAGTDAEPSGSNHELGRRWRRLVDPPNA